MLSGATTKFVFISKVLNGMTPEYLPSIAPSTVGITTRYRLRNKSDIQTTTIPALSQQ